MHVLSKRISFTSITLVSRMKGTVKYAIFVSIMLAALHHISNGFSFLLIKEAGAQDEITQWIEELMSSKRLKTSLNYTSLELEEENEYEKVCSALLGDIRFIVDVRWGKKKLPSNFSEMLNVPYIKLDLSISYVLRFLDAFLEYRNSTDVLLIFDGSKYVDQSLYYLIESTRQRIMIIDNMDTTAAEEIKNMRPIPNNMVIIGNKTGVSYLLVKAFNNSLFSLPDRWSLLFTDMSYTDFDRNNLNNIPMYLLYLDRESCCVIMGLERGCSCAKNFIPEREFLYIALTTLGDICTFVVPIEPGIDGCNNTTNDDDYSKQFLDALNEKLNQYDFINDLHGTLELILDGTIENEQQIVALYRNSAVLATEGKQIKPIKAFYRVGTTYALPWSYQETDPNTGKVYWTGYCIDFVQKLSELMDFDYELVLPKNGTFGEKKNGRWDGVVGDLASGAVDMAFTAMIMTADREEVVDFVAPYFEQSGVSIVIRKPVRKTSLFKFMTVLKLEVWLSIVGALIVTGFMVWFLDKYSPYSARNNKKAYPYPCREFTLKESFWFALTSFTPQGGGEAPKALSGRTLVAAYWLFVVLMLATFTANLAAFLTVERMQTPVQSLEQLARQSRINYTVVMGSETHQYFINMKNAEDTLYRLWKELTLNASTDEIQYRVWDYPIREQYGHILLAINDSMPVETAAEGFKKVNEHVDADFAFIHDSSEIKYEVSRNCNLTEVGEVFAEKPYAVAVQQGSHLQDEISKRILDLQKDRFFEKLQAKYWNHSAKGVCQNSDDSEGITLESLGGVFIATLFGLALAMITLAGEVIYYRRKRKINNSVQHKTLTVVKPPKTVTFGTTFKPPLTDRNIPRVTLYPRARNRLNNFPGYLD